MRKNRQINKLKKKSPQVSSFSNPSTPNGANETIKIELTIPKLRFIRLKQVYNFWLKLWRNKWFKRALILSVLMLTAYQAYTLTRPIIQKATKKPAAPLVTEQDKSAEVPFFETLIPQGKTIEQLGGWTRTSPPDKNAVFAYIDFIEKNRVVVGQQPLPEDFKEDTEDQLEHLAKTYKSTEKININGITVFINTSAKGPQSVLFVKKGLLVNIRSSITIKEDSWLDYINSLE